MKKAPGERIVVHHNARGFSKPVYLKKIRLTFQDLPESNEEAIGKVRQVVSKCTGIAKTRLTDRACDRHIYPTPRTVCERCMQYYYIDKQSEE